MSPKEKQATAKLAFAFSERINEQIFLRSRNKGLCKSLFASLM